ncbi:MAG TPA: CHASE3 domain-containing protein [Patescibacteria group bacterium]|nr:CHASE3 domain-containing protein [Patescibacteria group bacterium]
MIRNIENRILISFILIVAILGAVGYFAYKNVEEINRVNNKTLSVYEILSANQEIYVLSRDIEAGARGYMLTGQGEYLQPYYSAITEYPDRMTVLRKVADSTTRVYRQVDTLSHLMERRKSISENYIKVRQEKGLDSAVAVLRIGEGRIVSEQIKQLSHRIRRIEGEVLRTLLRENYSNLQQTVRNLFLLIGVIVLTLIVVFIIFRRDISGRKRAEQQLHDLNKSLEQQVMQRTEDLRRSFEDTEAKVKFRNLELEKQNRELLKRIADLEGK